MNLRHQFKAHADEAGRPPIDHNRKCLERGGPPQHFEDNISQSVRISTMSRYHLNGKRIRPLACLFVLVPALTIAVTTHAADLELYHSDYRKVTAADPGSLRVYLRNTSDREIALKHVLLDNLPIPVWGITNNLRFTPPHPDGPPGSAATNSAPSAYEVARKKYAHKRVIWSRVRPRTAAPGEIMEFVSKLQKPLHRPSKVTLIAESGERTDVVIRTGARPLDITAIRFSKDLTKTYLYYSNNRDVGDGVERVEMDGHTVPLSFWSAPSQVGQGEKGVVVISHASPLPQGAYRTFLIRTGTGVTAAERVRVFSHFPITMEWAEAPDDYGFDPDPAILSRYDSVKEGADSPTKNLVDHWHVNHLFDCIMHAYRADQTRSAEEILKRHDRWNGLDPLHLSSIHPCRIRPDEGYARFGDITDALKFNPFIDAHFARKAGATTPLAIAECVIKDAYAGASPRPVYGVVPSNFSADSGADDAASRLRRRVFALLAGGVQGVIYRPAHWGQDPENPLDAAIRDVNRELRLIQDTIGVSDVIDVSTSGAAPFTASALLAGDAALLLVVFSGEDSAKDAGGHDDPGAGDLVVRLPSWLVPESVEVVTPSGLSDGGAEVDGNLVRITPSELTSAQAYLVHTRRADG